MMTNQDHELLRQRLNEISEKVGIGSKLLADLLPTTRSTLVRTMTGQCNIATERRFNAVKRAVDDLFEADARFNAFAEAAKLGYYSRAKYLKQVVADMYNQVQQTTDPV